MTNDGVGAIYRTPVCLRMNIQWRRAASCNGLRCVDMHAIIYYHLVIARVCRCSPHRDTHPYSWENTHTSQTREIPRSFRVCLSLACPVPVFSRHVLQRSLRFVSRCRKNPFFHEGDILCTEEEVMPTHQTEVLC